jgi:DDE family transposase
MTWSLKRDLKRRSAIEPHIGHMKSDGKLGRNYLKGIVGAKLNALLSAIGHNLRLILNHIRDLFTLILKCIICALIPTYGKLTSYLIEKTYSSGPTHYRPHKSLNGLTPMVYLQDNLSETSNLSHYS